MVDPRTLLRILNEIFQSDCEDTDAIDVSATWGVIVEQLKPYRRYSLTLALRYQPGMRMRDVGQILGVSRERVHQICEMALRKLRADSSRRRIRNSIVGWPNFHRNAHGFETSIALAAHASVAEILPSARRYCCAD